MASLNRGHTDAEWESLFERFPQRPITLCKYAPLSALIAQEQHQANFMKTNRYLAYFDKEGEPVLVTVTPEVR
jgi:hypothetical protein